MTKNKNFVKDNTCPYCTYPCPLVANIKSGRRPIPGNLAFCLMCLNASIFDKEMHLIKFDLNSITDLIERNRLKVLQLKMRSFWDNDFHDSHVIKRREKYLAILDSK